MGEFDSSGRLRGSDSLLSIEVDEHSDAGIVIVRLLGVLSIGAVPRLRDTLLKCLADQPAAVIVDLELLAIQHPVALNVFAVVARRTAVWSGGQLILAAGPALEGRGRRQARALSRFVRIYPSLQIALTATGRAPLRRLAVWLLPIEAASPGAARRHVLEFCRSCGCESAADDAVVLADELVEQGMKHSTSDLILRLELRRGLLTIAATDDRSTGGDRESQFDPLSRRIVAEVATAWGSSATATGGTVVWAVLRVAAPAVGQ